MPSFTIPFAHPLRGVVLDGVASAAAPAGPAIRSRAEGAGPAPPPPHDAAAEQLLLEQARQEQTRHRELLEQRQREEQARQAEAQARQEQFALAAEALSRLERMVQADRLALGELAGQLQAASVELAVAAAAALLAERLESDRLRIEQIVAAAVAELPAEPTLIGYLNPQDLALLEQRRQEDASAAPFSPPLKPDPALPRGACRIEGETRGVMRQWQRQLTEMHRAMRGRIDG